MSRPGVRRAPARGGLLMAAVLALALLLPGCATVPATGAAPTVGQQADPWENFNRKVFAFNQGFDDAVLIPVATVWRDSVPQLARTGLANVFENFNDITSAANQLLQGRLQYGLEMGMRVLSNTLFGLGGLLDPATEMGLIRRPSDYGQTLARWGVGSGPFVMLPFFGPSTVRDSLVVPSRLVLGPSPTMFINDWAASLVLTGAFVVDSRAQLLSTTALIDSIALDKYIFVRDAFLAQRLEMIDNGASGLGTFIDEPADPPAKAPAQKTK